MATLARMNADSMQYVAGSAFEQPVRQYRFQEDFLLKLKNRV
jgi:hypothetical protein